MKRLFGKLKAQEGFTIVEVLVVVAIVGILAAVSFNLITSIFVTSLRSSQIATQEGNMERTFGFLGSRLALTQPSAQQLGLLDQEGSLVFPGNEIFFRSSYVGPDSGQVFCYRLHYELETRRLELAQTTSPSACIGLQKSEYTFNQIKSGEANFLGVQDVSTSVLSDGVIPLTTDNDLEVPQDACRENNVSSGSLFSYSGAGGSSTEVTASMAFCPTPEPDSIVRVPPRKFTQTFSIGQLCVVGSNPGSGDVGQGSIGPEQIESLPSGAATLTASSISSEAVDTDGTLQWYKVDPPAEWKDGLWKLFPGFYNVSASAQFSWDAAPESGDREAVAIAIVREGPNAPPESDPKIAYSSGPEIEGRAYAAVSIGIQLARNDDVSIWVASTSNTPDRFEGGRISGTWANN